MAITDDLILMALYPSPLHQGFNPPRYERRLNRKRPFDGEIKINPNACPQPKEHIVVGICSRPQPTRASRELHEGSLHQRYQLP
jgi:hypothetical protein